MFREYTDLLRSNRDYRYLWLGYLVSQMGDWFNLIASAALIALITDAGTALSYLFLARYLPLFVFSPVAGTLADRFDRRYVMIASDLLRALTVLGFLLVRDASQVWLFYLLTIAQFALSALFTPARSAVLANVVSKKELVTANALDSLTWSTMLAVGAMLGGVATAVFGITTAFVLDALTFVLSGWLIAQIDRTRMVPSGSAADLKMFRFVDGLRYLWGQPLLLVITLVKAGGSLVWGAINVLEINYAEEVFPVIFTVNWWGEPAEIGVGGTVTLAVIYTISGLGTGLGPLLLRRWLGDSFAALRLGITIGFGLLGIGMLGLSFSPNLGVFTVWTAVRTVGTGALWVFSAALLQMLVPDEVRGRVFAFEFAALTLTQSISIYWAGAAQDMLGLSVWQVTRWTGWGSMFVFAVWLLFHLATRHRPLTTFKGEAMEGAYATD